jgi:hypothetical protein
VATARACLGLTAASILITDYRGVPEQLAIFHTDKTDEWRGRILALARKLK